MLQPFELPLEGVKAQPLQSYLKGLGLIRILAGQAHPSRKNSWQFFWRNDRLHTIGNIDANNLSEIVGFIFNYWKPSPAVSPWNGSVGFYEGEPQAKLLDEFMASSSDRLKAIQETIKASRIVVREMGLTGKPKERIDKTQMIIKLRNRVPDEAVPWIDCCTTLNHENTLEFWSLLGTGGNDGNFEISRTYLQALQELFNLKDMKPHDDKRAITYAANSLIGVPMPIGKTKIKSGYFDPAHQYANPLDFVLMVEGLFLLSPNIQSRLAVGGVRFPCTRPPAGDGLKVDKPRPEFWAHLWHRPATITEIEKLFY